MKIKLDTEKKILSIEEQVNIGDLIDMLENMLPNGLWREFKLEVVVINNWTNPILVKEYPVYPSTPNPLPFQPYAPIQPYPNPISPCDPIYPWITYGTSTDSKTDFTISTIPGVFNVEYPKK